jgi:hypothetical protein
MTDDEEIVLPKNIILAVVISGIAAIVLFGLVFMAYKYANRVPGSILLPGGTTYLGPTETPKPRNPNLFYAEESTPLKEWKGTIYPYTIQYPETMSPGLFPNDPYDSVTIFWKDSDPNQNIFLRVENLEKDKNAKQFIGKPLRDYAEYWGKQYVWTTIKNYSEFTTDKGFKSNWVLFSDANGNESGDNYFMMVPNHPEIIIWMSSKIIEQKTFDRLVDTLEWKEENKQQTVESNKQ